MVWPGLFGVQQAKVEFLATPSPLRLLLLFLDLFALCEKELVIPACSVDSVGKHDLSSAPGTYVAGSW